MALDGVEIFTNSSGSHHEFRKLHTRVDLIKDATGKSGGVYLYANQQGCDGERVYYDGCSLILMNGQIVGQGTQFSLKDVPNNLLNYPVFKEVITATVDIEDVRAFRGSQPSRASQAAVAPVYPRVSADISLSYDIFKTGVMEKLSPVNPPRYHTPEEEIRLGPACWLWDYLRRSKSGGFFLPLSGGLDSCATAVIVHSMCLMVCEAAQNGGTVYAASSPYEWGLNISMIADTQVIADARRVVGQTDTDYIPKDPREFANYHIDLNMDGVVTAFLTVFKTVTDKTPRFRVRGGTETENLALQNVQARSRMVLAYMFAQLLLWYRGRSGALLVLGSANVDETADINPIGGISKVDLRKFLHYCKTALNMDMLEEFLDAPPTAELEPITKDYVQGDEVDMKMTYDELSVYGTLRKVSKCGPFGMFSKLLHEWGEHLSPTEIAERVKRFFFYYSINRHKTTILPPSYHMSPYSPDDNRYDLRPFLYNAAWTWQFRRIDESATALTEIQKKKGADAVKP
ncbi:glutamine-dependent NAD(+) synthetase [Borealophlyctis nickersoniae]|nr:glutamine-dependent NAD(+) synthetase [Borealophlyctis nickersoniae]